MMATPAISPTTIATSIGAAWSEFVSRDRQPSAPHPYVYASSWRVCDRRMVYEMTQPENQPAFEADVLARFRRGDDRERDILADLTRVGRDSTPPFKVIGQQERFQLKDRKGRIVVSGKVDARIELDRKTRPPIEIKAWAPFLTDKLETFEDLFENPWTRSGGYQLLSYLFGAAEPFGFLVLDRSGLPKVLPVELDANLDRMEGFLTKAERAVDHTIAGTLPDFLEDDPTECRRCPWYGQTCNPPLSATGAAVLVDAELEAKLKRRDELEAVGREYMNLDRDVKDRLRGVEQGVCGDFIITGKWGKQSRIELPAHLKKQYTVTNERGRFTLDITRAAK